MPRRGGPRLTAPGPRLRPRTLEDRTDITEAKARDIRARRRAATRPRSRKRAVPVAERGEDGGRGLRQGDKETRPEGRADRDDAEQARGQGREEEDGGRQPRPPPRAREVGQILSDLHTGRERVGGERVGNSGDGGASLPDVWRRPTMPLRSTSPLPQRRSSAVGTGPAAIRETGSAAIREPVAAAMAVPAPTASRQTTVAPRQATPVPTAPAARPLPPCLESQPALVNAEICVRCVKSRGLLTERLGRPRACTRANRFARCGACRNNECIPVPPRFRRSANYVEFARRAYAERRSGAPASANVRRYASQWGSMFDAWRRQGGPAKEGMMMEDMRANLERFERGMSLYGAQEPANEVADERFEASLSALMTAAERTRYL